MSLPFRVVTREVRVRGRDLYGYPSARFDLGSEVRFEIVGENGIEYASPWYSNMITDRFLIGFADKGFVAGNNHLDTLRRFLVIGASQSPKPEIKVTAPSGVTGSGSVDTSGPSPSYRFVLDSSSQQPNFFDTGALSGVDLAGWELVVPSTGEFAKVLQKVNGSTLSLDREITATNARFELWNVQADISSADRVGVSEQDSGSTQEVFGFDNTQGALTYVREIRREYTVTGSSPISFSYFGFAPDSPGSGSPTNATIIELVRDQYGTPTTITVNPGKRIRVYHRLVVSSPRVFPSKTPFSEYDLSDSLVSQSSVNTNVEIVVDTNSQSRISEVFKRVLSPASDIFNGENDVSVSLTVLGSNHQPTSHTKSFTSTNLLPYTGGFVRSREFVVGPSELVSGETPTQVHGFKFDVIKGSSTLFSVLFKFSSPITKDDLHEMKVYLNTSWYRRYDV